MEQPRRQKTLTVENMNPHVRTMEYAVRGPIVQRAVQLEHELREVICLRLSTTTIKFKLHLK